MARRIERHTVIVDGSEMFALRPADFERLDASRRQVGARNARVTRLHQQLGDARARLARIEAALAAAGPADCVCRELAAIIDSTEPAAQMSRTTG